MTDANAISRITTTLAGLDEAVGLSLGPTDWSEMTQNEVDVFANLTGDHNFLHVDPDRARATPFGGTIAHGFLSLSLLAPAAQLLTVSDATAAVNYGLDKVRFPAPLPVGARWRAGGSITRVDDVPSGRQVAMTIAIETEHAERPSVVAEILVRFYA